MEIIYRNDTGASVTLRQITPVFLSRVDGVGHLRNSINTFQAPHQDGAFFISSSLDMRNITIEERQGAPCRELRFAQESRRYFVVFPREAS
jgi:hypothetical protein